MRNAFVSALIKEAEKDKRIFLLTGDLGYTVFEDYIAKFPDRFLNVGVAEANMMGIASGLANSGFIPVTYSIATFVSMQAFEQVRNDIILPSVNVKIVGVGAGLGYSHAGPTHHAIEDIAILRTMPALHIFTPSDPVSTEKMTKMMLLHIGPCYLRLGKKGEPVIYQPQMKFTIGKGKILSEGDDCTIVATGSILHNVLLASQLLKKRDINARVIDICTVKPIDSLLLIDSIKRSQYIFTVEEHTIIGGLGSAVAEVLSEAGRTFILKRIGIPDTFCTTIGDHQYLQKYYSLSPEGISKKVINLLS